jgi:two-component system sensor histidine kinase UhpB
LRSAIQADAAPPRGVDEKAASEHAPLRRSRVRARQITVDIGSVLLGSLGLAATIEWHVRQFQKSTGVPCNLTVVENAGIDLPEYYAGTIFDIYSEAMSNIARHAKATRVAVTLSIAGREVALVVRDDGIGLATDASRSSNGGIGGMRARAKALKGFCDVAGVHNGGTIVTVSLPFVRN